jgi:putative PIN family toxin of toxin-antitoxin system
VPGKPRVILDSSTVASGIGWRGEARVVLRLLAAGGFESYRTPWLTSEWAETVQRVAAEEKLWKNPNWANWLIWLKTASKLLPDIPAKKTVKRDPKDDPVIMAAVSVNANYLVTTDKDLLDLGKPYGVSCATPRVFLSETLKRN